MVCRVRYLYARNYIWFTYGPIVMCCYVHVLPNSRITNWCEVRTQSMVSDNAIEVPGRVARGN